ncbi:lysosomal acid glucosylceramidase-like [Battus philenor]|uniref:lysosomal acid glucosylceramidase-like n=1 Tax=Battus philenor TaxID=42288 RepID=UPI0035CF4690
MSKKPNLLFITLTILFSEFYSGNCDLPCRPRDVGIPGRSIVCVCDAEYCDTITRESPEPGTFVAYSSSNGGQRFEKSYGVVQSEDQATKNEDFDEDITSSLRNKFAKAREVVLRVITSSTKQLIEGFGGSVTDAAGINWRKLSKGAQKQLIDTYFGPEGLEYNMIRVPIGGADFSTHPYTYNELPWNDGGLTNYSLSPEDFSYKIPMIKMAEEAATKRIKITATTWSPPVWMKTNEKITGFGQIKREFYQTYADYQLRFIEEYDKQNVKIWAITTTNEPINGIIPAVNFNSLGWFPTQLGQWVANNLGPTIRNSRFNETLILAVDDQRYILPIWLRGMERGDPKSIEYIDGIAIHYYGNFVPASVLTRIQNRYPNKILLSTEACEGPMPWDQNKVEAGSWARASRYIRSILEDLNNFVVGWIDWNLCLDENGGPNWADNFVDSPILVHGDSDEFIKNPMFYAMGHFSKFIPPGSVVVEVSRLTVTTVPNIAVITPQGNLVVVLHNTRSSQVNVRVKTSVNKYIDVSMEPESVKTIEINDELLF